MAVHYRSGIVLLFPDHELGCDAVTGKPSKEVEAFREVLDGSGVVPDTDLLIAI